MHVALWLETPESSVVIVSERDVTAAPKSAVVDVVTAATVEAVTVVDVAGSPSILHAENKRASTSIEAERRRIHVPPYRRTPWPHSPTTCRVRMTGNMHLRRGEHMCRYVRSAVGGRTDRYRESLRMVSIPMAIPASVSASATTVSAEGGSP